MAKQARIVGFAEVTKALNTLPREIVGRGARGPVAQALRKTLKPVQQEAQARAPEGLEGVTSDDPGRLKRSIKLFRRNDAAQLGVDEAYTVSPNPGKSRSDASGAWYWHFIEFGSSKQKPQPYLRPAWDQYERQYAADFARNIKKRVDQITKRLERNKRRQP